jgi:hypothetical protein
MDNIILVPESYKTNDNGEVTLQLKTAPNGHVSLGKPSGKRVTGSMLEVKKTYLHKNGFFMRTILAIVKDSVFYFDGYTTGCSKLHSFTSVCRHEATNDEMEYLLKIQKGEKYYTSYPKYVEFAKDYNAWGISGCEIVNVINKLNK